MERTPVVSSTVASVGHDPSTATLEVEFLNGSIYQYFDVPEHVANALRTAGTVGGYLAENIKGVYRYARV